MKSLREFWKSFKKLIKVKKPDVPKDNKDLRSPEKVSACGSHRVINEGHAPLFIRKPEKVHLQVGLDFGTSSTKIVYSHIGKRISRAITFDHNLPTFPKYCLPSLAAIDKKGKLLLGIRAARLLLQKEWDSGLQRFKVLVAGNHEESFKDPVTEKKFYEYLRAKKYDASLTPERLTAIYLAYAMNRARKIIEAYPGYKDVDLDIAYNICMPIDHLENNKVLSVFKEIFAWAEAIADDWCIKGKGFDPLKASYELEPKEDNPAKRVFAVPEAVAAIASYLISLRRQEGLHAIIDLGAGTSDVSVCNILLPFGELKSYWYAAKNIPRGTINIERRISDHLKKFNNKTKCTIEDVYECLNSLSRSVLNSKKLATAPRTRLQDAIFREIESLRNSDEYYKTWGSAYTKHLKKQSKWEKFEIFICGGGAKLPFLEEVFSKPWWSQLKVRYPVSVLPTPLDYDEKESGAPFERMAVAYGLARPFPTFDDYVLPADAPDHTPSPLPIKEVDTDELYPKR